MTRLGQCSMHCGKQRWQFCRLNRIVADVSRDDIGSEFNEVWSGDTLGHEFLSFDGRRVNRRENRTKAVPSNQQDWFPIAQFRPVILAALIAICSFYKTIAYDLARSLVPFAMNLSPGKS
jgi:hypothetical protein